MYGISHRLIKLGKYLQKGFCLQHKCQMLTMSVVYMLPVKKAVNTFHCSHNTHCLSKSSKLITDSSHPHVGLIVHRDHDRCHDDDHYRDAPEKIKNIVILA